MTAPRHLRWVRRAQQERSQKTLERILDATEELLAEDTFDQITVQQIVKRARSSVGSFYGRFPDKRALLHTVHERFVEEALATAEEALAPDRWEGVPLGPLIDTMVVFLVDDYLSKAGVRRAYIRASIDDEAFADRIRWLDKRVHALWAELLAVRPHEWRGDDPLVVARDTYDAIIGTLDRNYLYGSVAEDSRPGLVAQVQRIAHGVLSLS